MEGQRLSMFDRVSAFAIRLYVVVFAHNNETGADESSEREVTWGKKKKKLTKNPSPFLGRESNSGHWIDLRSSSALVDGSPSRSIAQSLTPLGQRVRSRRKSLTGCLTVVVMYDCCVITTWACPVKTRQFFWV